MALSQFSAGQVLNDTDLDAIVNHLQGASGSTDAWHFRSSTGNNFLVTLSDNAGARKFSIRDSDGTEVFSVTSDGALTAVSNVFTSLDIPTSSSPSQTTEGRAVWDSDDDVLTIGDGSSRKTFGYLGTSVALASGTAAAGTSSEASRVDHVHPDGTISGAAQAFVEAGVHKGFAALGSPTGAHTYADDDLIGMGFVVQETNSGSVTTTTSGALSGTWTFSTSTTGSSDAGVFGPSYLYTADWTLVWRGILPTNAALLAAFIGCKANANFADENNVIAFRVLTTGNIFGVCDSGGTETTRDTGVTPDGSTEHTLRIEVRSAGTIVRFYLDDVQVGADVTTNIPTASLTACIGLQNNTTTDVTMRTSDAYCWREI